MNSEEADKSKSHYFSNIIDYVPDSVVSKTFIKKKTGNICAYALEAGETLYEKMCPFDIFISIVEGKAEIIINNIVNLLESGQSIIIPAHSCSVINATAKLKMITKILKNQDKTNK